MLVTLSLLLALASAPIDSYNQGNKLYAQKDYAGATAAYEQALKAGPNARAHYNLANALFKSGNIGQAIVHYRRAHYLDPRDGDVRTNLAFVRNYRVDKILTVSSPFAKLLDDTFHRLSRREAGLGAAAFFMLGALSLAVWILRRWAALVAAAVLFGVLSLFCFVTERAWIGEINARPAVVTAPEVSARSGPSEESNQILLLHDGTEVRIREARGDYLLAQVPGGSGGWIKKDAVERVY
jgi:tetratricopeptide (TPR) repeat protein